MAMLNLHFDHQSKREVVYFWLQNVLKEIQNMFSSYGDTWEDWENSKSCGKHLPLAFLVLPNSLSDRKTRHVFYLRVSVGGIHLL